MNIIRNAAVISAITLISRIFGYFRDIIIASYLGTGPLNDAFIAAFKFANLFRNIFGEGAFTSAFVPIFTHKLSYEGINKALQLAALVQALLIATLIFFSVIAIYLMPYILSITTPGFLKERHYFEVAVEVGRITFPYLFFISLAAFYGGILHSIGKFMPFAATAIIFNISIILFALYYNNDGQTKAHSIAYGVIAAGVLEFLWMLLFLKLNNVLVPLNLPKLSPDIKILLTRMGAGVIGSGIVQINTWVDMIIVSFVPGGLSYIYYADRIIQLPLALIATASSTALLPILSKHLANTNKTEVKNIKNSALRVSAFFLIPSTLVLSFFAHEIISFLLERGKFNTESSSKTAAALQISALALPAFALIKLFSSNFHAHGDTKTPVQIAFGSLLINIVVATVLIQPLEHTSIAVASTASSWFAALMLIKIADNRSYYNFTTNFIKELCFYLSNTVLVCILMYWITHTLNINIIFSLAIGGSSYLCLCYVFINILKTND